MSIEVIAHRGLWSRPDEGNTIAALIQALERGYGVETDVRDRDGRLVISHDPAHSASPDLRDFCSHYAALNATSVVAVNIKSDGLVDQVRDTLADYQITNYFVFDMSVPDAVQYARRSLPMFSRHSDIESCVNLYEESLGVWMDCFLSDWFTASHLIEHFQAGKDVCVVSPELHGRPHRAVWQWLRGMTAPPGRRLMLCTDYPEQFRQE